MLVLTAAVDGEKGVPDDDDDVSDDDGRRR